MEINKDLIGKKIVRTEANKNGDCSYTRTAIEITNVTSGLLYFKSPYTDELRYHSLLRSEYDDGKWELWQPTPKTTTER